MSSIESKATGPNSDGSALMRLPLELRNLIHDFALDYTHEVEVYGKCVPFSVLTLVSKQLNAEGKAVVARRKKNGRCEHSNFSFTLWDPRELIEIVREERGWGTKGMRCEREHDLGNAESVRIICVGSGSDNPLAVTLRCEEEASEEKVSIAGGVHWVDVGDHGFTIWGASAWREEELRRRFYELLVSKGEGEKDKAVLELLIGMRIALHRVW